MTLSGYSQKVQTGSLVKYEVLQMLTGNVMFFLSYLVHSVRMLSAFSYVSVGVHQEDVDKLEKFDIKQS